jgi:hypothetical protein
MFLITSKSKPGLFMQSRSQDWDFGHVWIASNRNIIKNLMLVILAHHLLACRASLGARAIITRSPDSCLDDIVRKKNMIWPLPTDQTDPNVATKQTTPFMSQYVRFVACGSNLNSCLIQFCHNSLENKPASFYHLGGPLRHTSDVSHNALKKHKH